MYAGQIVERAPVDDAVPLPQHPYTVGPARLACRGSSSARPRLAAIEGTVPEHDARRRRAAASRRAARSRIAHCAEPPPLARRRRRPPRRAAGGRRWRARRMTAPLLAVDDLVKHFVARRSLLGRPLTIGEGGRRRRPSCSAPAKRWRWSASPAAASRRSAACVLRLIEPTAGRVRLRRRATSLALGRRDLPRRCAASMQLIFQDPYRLAQSAHDRRRDPRRAADAARASCRPPTRDASASPSCSRLVGLRAALCRPLSARILRRPAPAHRHRPRARGRAEADRLRRAGVGARRVDPRADPQPAARTCSARLGLAYIFISPRSRGGEAHRRPHRGDVSRPHRRDAAGRRDLRRAAPPLHAGAAVGDPGRRRPTRTPRAPASCQGDVPSPIDPPPGCHLHPRCPYVIERCRRERPALDRRRRGHAMACHVWRELPPAGRHAGREPVDPRARSA